MTISDEIKALVSTLEMQLNGFTKAAYEKDLRIADLERQLAEAAPPACLIEPFVMPQKVHVHHIAAIAKCSGIFGLVSMSEIQKFALALLNEFSTAEASAPAVEQPIGHISKGMLEQLRERLGVSGYVQSGRTEEFPVAIYATPQAADTDKVREAMTRIANELEGAAGAYSGDFPDEIARCVEELRNAASTIGGVK